MRRALLPVTLAGWALVALALLATFAAAPGRTGFVALLSALGALGLAAFAWLRPGRAGRLALVVLALAAVFDALWWGAWPVFLLLLPPLALLAPGPGPRAPVVPKGAAVLLVLGLAYLALAPAVDAFALPSPPVPAPSVTAPSVRFEDEQQRGLGGGAGAAWEQPVRFNRTSVTGLVRAAYPEGADVAPALRAAYAPGAQATLAFLFFPGSVVEQGGAAGRDLGGGWQRVEAVYARTSVASFAVPASDGERHVFLLKNVAARTRLSLLPPFVVPETVYLGYHLGPEGNQTRNLQRLDGNVSWDGQVLTLPTNAATTRAPAVFRTPGVEAGALLAAVGAAACAAGRKGKRPGL